MPLLTQGQAELIIRDSPADTGAEPDTAIDPSVNPNGEMWVSQDIWVTQTPMSGYTPYPFSSSSPPLWLTANPNQNPQYRDPVLSQPNYVYVRISNVGTSASLGTEQLHVYWAKASTGLSWPNQWVDYMDTICGPSVLYGIEITKPRQNIATAPLSVVQSYLSAVNEVATSGALQFPDGVQDWYKQDAEHHFVASQYVNGPTLPSGPDAGAPVFGAHGTDGFWPWHREFLNRYEALLRKANPLVTLLYWDWTTDPRTWSVNLGGDVTAASPNGFGTLEGEIASAFNNSSQITLASTPVGGTGASGITTTVYRFVGTYPGYTSPETTPDSTILGETTFSDAAAETEGRGGGSDEAHNYSHMFIGGYSGSTIGDMDAVAASVEDPFFFLLHGNVDRLWSQWQRTAASGVTYGSRFDPSTTGGNAMAYLGSQNYMYQPMAPWNGLTYNGTSPNPPGNPEVVVSPLTPWTQTAGDETTYKEANDDSVVFPPIYDVAPLTVPVLQPGQSVVIEIPWYPPNPTDYSCFGTDAGHVCLLARITTSSTAPYGMDSPETSDLTSNVKNNNKIAWRNEMVLDGGLSAPGPVINDAVFVRSFSSNSPVQLGLTLTVNGGQTLANFGTVVLDLGPALYSEWVNGGAVGNNVVPYTNGTSGTSGTALELTATNGYVGNIDMSSNELERVQVELVLNNGYANPQGKTFGAMLTQTGGGTVAGNNGPVGGQLFTFNFNQLDIVPKGSTWLYWDTGQYPGPSWNQLGFDDSQWASGAALLGYGIGDELTVLNGGPIDSSYITTWFRYDFQVNDPAFFTNLWLRLEAYDGAVVYLNGTEIARWNMPSGAISPGTPALASETGLAAQTYYPFNVSSFLPLLGSTNVLAVEVHSADTNNSGEMGLNAELDGNVFSPSYPPQAAFQTTSTNNGPNNGLYLYGRNILLQANTVATLNPVKSVNYYADGAFLGSATVPPFSLTWTNPPLGIHQVTVQPEDSVGLNSESFVTLDVLTNVPPTIYLTAPVPGQIFLPNTPVTVTANVQKIGGGIQKVDFYYAQHGLFSYPQVLAGTVTTPPYTMQINGIPAGGYMVYAIATDTAGARSWAVPVHIIVPRSPTVTVSSTPPFITLAWSPTNAVLQQATSLLGPWESVSNVSSPYGFMPKAAASKMFFRVSLPLDDGICSP